MEKHCSKCDLFKDLSDFYPCKTTVDRLRPECKECQKTYRSKSLRIKKQVTPEYRRERTLRYKYGLTLDEFKRMLEEQGHRCKICQSDKSGKGDLGFSVDHDHFTGKIRGLLCHPCNAGLGFFKESEEVMVRAARYLKGKL